MCFVEIKGKFNSIFNDSLETKILNDMVVGHCVLSRLLM